MTTADKIRQIITDSMEDTGRAERVLAALAKFEGKRLDKRVAKKVEEETGEKIYISTQYGMTHLHVGGYGFHNDPDPGLGLLLAHRTTSVMIDTKAIRDRNTCYFEAARVRNEEREKALEYADINGLGEAIDAFNAAHERIQTKFNLELHVEKCSLAKLMATHPEFGK